MKMNHVVQSLNLALFHYYLYNNNGVVGNLNHAVYFSKSRYD